MTDTLSINNKTVAVDRAYELQPMSTAPRGVKIQLENPVGVLVYGTYNGRDTFWQGWAPLPCRSKNMQGVENE